MNLAELDQSLFDLIKAGAPAGVAVLRAEELGAVEERSQAAPAAHLVYDGYRVLESNEARRAARLVHRWLVVACTRSAAGRGQGEGARNKAADLAQALAAALMGHPVQAAGRAHLLRLVTAPAPVYSAGFCYIPLAFELETVFTANP